MAVITQTNTTGVTIRDVIGEDQGIPTAGGTVAGFLGDMALSGFKMAYTYARLALEAPSSTPLTSNFYVETVTNRGTTATGNLVSVDLKNSDGSKWFSLIGTVTPK